jgi:hypothetical protein
VPAAYRVCAYYYLGRTELNSDNIAGGIDMLQAAFSECKADSENVKHILRALVPVSNTAHAGCCLYCHVHAMPCVARQTVKM